MNWKLWCRLQEFKFRLWWNRVVKKEVIYVPKGQVRIVVEKTEWPDHVLVIE